MVFFWLYLLQEMHFRKLCQCARCTRRVWSALPFNLLKDDDVLVFESLPVDLLLAFGERASESLSYEHVPSG